MPTVTPSVDLDRHVQETWSIFADYAEPAFRAHVYRKVALPDGSSRLAVGDRLTPFSTAMWSDPYANRMFDDDRFAPNLPLREGFDPAGYLRTMDREGIDVAILTPTLALGNYTIPSGAVGSALSRAYGRWVADFCSLAPERLKPLYPVNLFDVAQAVTDSRWAVRELRAVGLLVLPLPVGGRPLHHPDLDPFWSAAESLDVAVQIHSISSLPDEQGQGPLVEVIAGAARFGGNLFVHHLISHRLEQQLALASLIGGGVLARHPRLRCVFSEAGGQWVQSWLEEMDARHRSPMLRRSVPWMTLLPSEYFRRQCLVAFHADEPIRPSIGRTLPIENVGWASDFPHHDSLFPGAGAAIRRQLEEFSDEQRARMLGGNARRCLRVA